MALIYKWERFIPPQPRNIIVLFHGYGQVFPNGLLPWGSGVLRTIWQSSNFRVVASATNSIVLLPYAVGGNWLTGYYTSAPQYHAVLSAIDQVQAEYTQELDVYYGGFSDGATFAHIMGLFDPHASGVLVYSGPMRGLDYKPAGNPRYMFAMNKQEVANTNRRQPNGEWRMEFIDWASKHGARWDSVTGDVPGDKVLDYHRWDVKLNPEFVDWLEGKPVLR